MDLFSKIKSFRTVWPSSVIRWTSSTWKVARDLYFSCATRAQSVLFVRDLLCFTCAICCILRARAVHDLCLIRARSVHDLCIFLRSSRARCFSRSRVRTPAHAARSFYWSQVRFRGLVACFRPVESVAYVTRPHDWRIRLACGKIKPP